LMDWSILTLEEVCGGMYTPSQPWFWRSLVNLLHFIPISFVICSKNCLY
jgi:hypothetical protein